MLKRKAKEHNYQGYQPVYDSEKNKRPRNDGEFSSSTLSDDEMSNDDLSASDKNSREIHSPDESVSDPSELPLAQVQPSPRYQGMLAGNGFSRSPTFDGREHKNQLSSFSGATEEENDSISVDFEKSLSF